MNDSESRGPTANTTCPDCGRCFSRVEHMKRHRLGHTKKPDFVCTVCTKSFYRLDALKRHQTIHLQDTGRKQASNAYVGKVRQACKRCSRMKLKCDGEQPCQRCRKAGHTTRCHFRPAVVNAIPDVQSGSTTQEIIEPESLLPERDLLMSSPPQQQQWHMSIATPTMPSVHFAIDTELDPRLLEPTSSPGQEIDLTMSGDVLLGGHQAEELMNTAPSTDLDWLFSGFSPLDQMIDSFPPMNSWIMHGLVEERSEADVITARTVSRPTSPLRILSEAAALTTTTSVDEDTPESIHQRRQLLPGDVYAPSRRPSITEGGASGSLRQNWPTSYYPAAAGQPYLTTVFEPVSDDVALLEDTCQVPEFDDASRQSILSVAELLPPQDVANVRAVLSSIDNRSYNVMLQLYFEEFHAFFPFLHVPTFNPAKCSPFLLMAICAVGCSFSKMRQAASLSDWLIDIAHRTVRAQCDQNMFHARSISTIQALLLCCITFGTSANRRLFEHGEALHSALATMVRRSNLLERRSRPQVTGDQQQQWTAWVTYEAAKRTAWACFVADIELASCWKFSSTYIYDELRADLPCPDHHWAADSASIWGEAEQIVAYSLADLHALIRQGSGLDGRSLFERKILALSLCNIGLSLSGALNPFVVLTIQPAINEFGDLLESTASKAARHPGPAATTYEALLRYVHLGGSVHFIDLQALGGRRGRLEAESALSAIIGRFRQDANTLANAAVLAGRIVHLVRSARLLTTCTANILFYAALTLYAIAKYLQDPSQTQKTTRKINLDTGTVLRLSQIDPGATFTLKGVGDLSSDGAASRVLSVYSDMLMNDVTTQARGISKRLGRLLRHMADSKS